MKPKPASWWSAENELISRQHLLKPRALSAELIGLSRDELDWLDALATTANHAADSYRHSPEFTMAQRVEYMTGEDERLVKWLPKVVPVLDELCERLEEPFLAFAWEAWDTNAPGRKAYCRFSWPEFRKFQRHTAPQLVAELLHEFYREWRPPVPRPDTFATQGAFSEYMRSVSFVTWFAQDEDTLYGGAIAVSGGGIRDVSLSGLEPRLREEASKIPARQKADTPPIDPSLRHVEGDTAT
jgi:hypothetical protein